MLIQRHSDRRPARVAHSWERIEKWLKEHLPEILADLRPGLSEADLAKCEEALDQRLPDDVRESYRIHDGQEGDRILKPTPSGDGLVGCPGVIFGLPLLPLQASVDDWSFWAELADQEATSDADSGLSEGSSSFPLGAIRCQHANRGWIPLHASDGNCFGIDVDPGPNGLVGQVINFGRDQENKFVLAVSWAHFLEDVADELEAGHFIIEKDSSDVLRFGLKQSRFEGDGFYNLYQEWSESKLPLDFQSALAPQEEIVLPAAIEGKVADVSAAVVRAFVEAMHEYEMHWLKIRPLKELGLSSLTESQYGWSSQGAPVQQSSAAISCGSFIINDPVTGKSDFQAMMANMQAQHGRQAEHLRIGVFRQEAIAQKRRILARFCTARQRRADDEFVQTDPPTYDPARCRVARVAQDAPDHALVFMQPESRFTSSGSETVTIRYHLQKVGEDWLVDLREEATDDKHFKKVSL
jgi:cell wall assembly regulator SMI1